MSLRSSLLVYGRLIVQPTTEQSHILASATGSDKNLMINALAGTGKTSTLEMIEQAVKARPVLYMVFNRKNADEAEKRMLSTTTVRTFNSLGHRVWAKAQAKNKLVLNSRKSQEILREIIKAAPKNTSNALWSVFWDIIAGVGLAKSLGYVPEGKYPNAKRLITQGEFHNQLDESPDDLVGDLIDAVLTQSIKLSYDGVIDYNDQIYMPALFGGTFPQFPLVLVDEYQDLNPVNHAMLKKLARKRLIGVGDPWQSIYAFRGAKRGGMDTARAEYAMESLDLSISFRCPEAIVANVLWRVPHFKAFKEGGSVNTPTHLSPSDIADTAVVICRNNAPLLAAALRLLSNGRSVSVSGSDIGPKLIAFMKKLGSEEMSRAQTLSAIADWEAEKLARESTSARDLAACMRVFAEHGDSLSQAIAYAEHVLAQKGTIRLMTGHKSKGLEFDTVYHLDSWLVRSGHNGAPPTEQDKNLDYVISTRSKDKLIEIDSKNIRW